jgi:hypothetical protein
MKRSALAIDPTFQRCVRDGGSIGSNLVNGKQIDVAEHSLLSSTLVRLAQRIGINRLPKNVTPYLHDYLEQHAATSDDEDAAA